jgi:hypothetical protein
MQILLNLDFGQFSTKKTNTYLHFFSIKNLNLSPLFSEADKVPFSTQKSREVLAINNWMTAFTAQYLPPDCNDYMRVEMRIVHPYYVRYGFKKLELLSWGFCFGFLWKNFVRFL